MNSDQQASTSKDLKIYAIRYERGSGDEEGDVVGVGQLHCPCSSPAYNRQQLRSYMIL